MKNKKQKEGELTQWGYVGGKGSPENGKSGYQPRETTPAAPPTHGSNIRKPEKRVDVNLEWGVAPVSISVGDVVNPIGTDFVAKVLEVHTGTQLVKVIRFLPNSEPLYYYANQLRVFR